MQDLIVPDEEDHLNADEHSSRDQLATVDVVLDEVPDHQAEGDDEEDDPDDGVEALHAVDGHIQEVQEEENNVDDDDDEVEAAGVAEASLIEAGLAAVPVGAQKRASDETADDLQDLDDASVGAQVTSVETRHFGR